MMAIRFHMKHGSRPRTTARSDKNRNGTQGIRLVLGLVVALVIVTLGTHALADGPALTPAHDHATLDQAGSHSPGGHGDAHGGKSGEINPLGFKGDLAIWTGVVFLVLLFVLGKFAWGPITSGLDKREQGIASQIEQAERANQQAQELLSQHQAKLDDAKDEVRAIVEAGRRDAETVGQTLIDKAKGEAADEQQRALRQIELAKTNALQELATLGADLAVELAGKIVRSELKPQDHAQLIDSTVARFADRNPHHN